MEVVQDPIHILKQMTTKDLEDLKPKVQDKQKEVKRINKTHKTRVLEKMGELEETRELEEMRELAETKGLRKLEEIKGLEETRDSTVRTNQYAKE